MFAFVFMVLQAADGLAKIGTAYRFKTDRFELQTRSKKEKLCTFSMCIFGMMCIQYVLCFARPMKRKPENFISNCVQQVRIAMFASADCDYNWMLQRFGKEWFGFMSSDCFSFFWFRHVSKPHQMLLLVWFVEKRWFVKDNVVSVANNSTNTRKRNIAILMAGIVQRYQLNSQEHLFAPLQRAGWQIDYFYSLFRGNEGAWHKEAADFEPDPDLAKVEQNKLGETISSKVGRFGANVAYSKIFDAYDNDSDSLSYINEGELWAFAGERGRGARNNFVHLQKELNMMWQEAKRLEKEKGFQYEYVMIIRDDAYWLKDFDLDRMLQIGGNVKLSGEGHGRVFSLACDADLLRFDPRGGILDYVFLGDRESANWFGEVYNYLVRPQDIGHSWMGHLDNTKPINSETFYLELFNFTGAEIVEVPPGLIPMQRIGRLKGTLCLHKYCDSNLTKDGQVLVPFLHPELPECPES